MTTKREIVAASVKALGIAGFTLLLTTAYVELGNQSLMRRTDYPDLTSARDGETCWAPWIPDDAKSIVAWRSADDGSCAGTFRLEPLSAHAWYSSLQRIEPERVWVFSPQSKEWPRSLSGSLAPKDFRRRGLEVGCVPSERGGTAYVAVDQGSGRVYYWRRPWSPARCAE